MEKCGECRHACEARRSPDRHAAADVHRPLAARRIRPEPDARALIESSPSRRQGGAWAMRATMMPSIRDAGTVTVNAPPCHVGALQVFSSAIGQTGLAQRRPCGRAEALGQMGNGVSHLHSATRTARSVASCMKTPALVLADFKRKAVIVFHSCRAPRRTAAMPLCGGFQVPITVWISAG